MSKCPPYYAWLNVGVEPRVIGAKLGFNLGQAFCYMVRRGRKPGEDAIKDLRKAISYIEFEIEAILSERGESPAEQEAPAEVATADEPRTDSEAFLAALRAAWPCHQAKDGTWQAMSGLYFAAQGDPGPPVAARWKCSPAKEKAIREAMKSIAKNGGYEDEGNRQAALDGSTRREGGIRE